MAPLANISILVLLVICSGVVQSVPVEVTVDDSSAESDKDSIVCSKDKDSSVVLEQGPPKLPEKTDSAPVDKVFRLLNGGETFPGFTVVGNLMPSIVAAEPQQVEEISLGKFRKTFDDPLGNVEKFWKNFRNGDFPGFSLRQNMAAVPRFVPEDLDVDNGHKLRRTFDLEADGDLTHYRNGDFPGFSLEQNMKPLPRLVEKKNKVEDEEASLSLFPTLQKYLPGQLFPGFSITQRMRMSSESILNEMELAEAWKLLRATPAWLKPDPPTIDATGIHLPYLFPYLFPGQTFPGFSVSQNLVSKVQQFLPIKLKDSDAKADCSPFRSANFPIGQPLVSGENYKELHKSGRPLTNAEISEADAKVLEKTSSELVDENLDDEKQSLKTSAKVTENNRPKFSIIPEGSTGRVTITFRDTSTITTELLDFLQDALEKFEQMMDFGNLFPNFPQQEDKDTPTTVYNEPASYPIAHVQGQPEPTFAQIIQKNLTSNRAGDQESSKLTERDTNEEASKRDPSRATITIVKDDFPYSTTLKPPRPLWATIMDPFGILPGWLVPSAQWSRFAQRLQKLLPQFGPKQRLLIANNDQEMSCDPDESLALEHPEAEAETDNFESTKHDSKDLKRLVEIRGKTADSEEILEPLMDFDESQVWARAAKVLETEATLLADTPMCSTLESSAGKCSSFCQTNRLGNGACVAFERCVCLLDEIGMVFAQITELQENFSQDSVEEDALKGGGNWEDVNSEEAAPFDRSGRGEDLNLDGEENCARCKCSEACRSSGAFVGYCDQAQNTCYCALPWAQNVISL